MHSAPARDRSLAARSCRFQSRHPLPGDSPALPTAAPPSPRQDFRLSPRSLLARTKNLADKAGAESPSGSRPWPVILGLRKNKSWLAGNTRIRCQDSFRGPPAAIPPLLPAYSASRACWPAPQDAATARGFLLVRAPRGTRPQTPPELAPPVLSPRRIRRRLPVKTIRHHP